MVFYSGSHIVAAVAAYASFVHLSASQPSPSPSPACSQLRPSSLPSAADLAGLLKPQIASVCSSLGEDSGSIASDLIQGFVFFGGPAPGRTSDCEQAFQDIILQCVQQRNYYGGELVYADTQLYNLTNARGTLNPILSGSGAAQLTTSVSIATPAAPIASSNSSSKASLSTQLTTSQSSVLSGSAQNTQTSSNVSSTALSSTISQPASTTNSTSVSSSSPGSSASSSVPSQSPSSTLTSTASTSGTSSSSTSSPTATSVGQSGGPSTVSITSSMSTTLPPTAAASATSQASTAIAAIASYSQSPTKENANNAKSHIDDALAAAVLLAAGTTGALAAAFGGLLAALQTAQTAAIAAVATPGAATAAALVADVAAVETALMEEEKAEEEMQNSSQVTSQSTSNSKSNTPSSSSLITSSTSLSSTSSSSSACSATGTGSVCSSGLIPIYTIDADTFGGVQDVLNAAHISSRLAAINAEGQGGSTQSNASTIASSTPASSLFSSAASTTTSSSATSTPTLNCQQNIPSGGPEPSQVANALTSGNGIANVCAAKFDGSGDSTHETFNHGSISIELIRSSATQALAHCNDALTSIINTCILGSADYGGVFSQDGETYNVTNTIAPANPLIPGADPGAPSVTASTAIAATTQQSVPTSSAPPAPPTPSQTSSNNKGSALCHSLAGACKVAYKGYNDTWLYTQYTSYPANPGDADPVNSFFAPFANDGCAAIFTCDNNDAFSVGMLGSQIKAAFDNLFANDKVKECGSSYLSNSCHVTVNGCSDCKASIPCGALPASAPGDFPCYGGKNPNAHKRALRFRQ